MDSDRTRTAYAARADEYAQRFGFMEATAAVDRSRVETWAAGVDGWILDAGCGPGHWTAHLAGLGHDAEGIDPVPEFIDIARRAHPGIPYRVASFDALELEPRCYGGVLAWYSLIHLPPDRIPDTVRIMRSTLTPGGLLLLGVFDGAELAPFAHAVTEAHFWPVDRMAEALDAVGFDVLETEQRTDDGARPHAAISARSR